MTSGRVFIQYFRLLFFPVRVTGDYDFNSIPVAGPRDWDAWLGLILVGGMIACAFYVAKKRPAIALGILFFFVALLPVSNWILPIALLMAERFLYTPVFGFALLAGLAWTGIRDQGLRAIVAGGIVATAVILCISHNYIWQDTFTFHKNAVRALPQNARARIGYGFALLRLDKAEDAKVQFEAGLRIKPNSAPLLAGLANTLIRIDGRCDRVRSLLAQAFAVEPGHWQSLWVLGDCFALEGKTEQAEQSYHLAIQNAEFPDAKLLVSWGRLLEAQGKTRAAIAAYERAAVIDPDDQGIKARLKQLARE
jgi:tetratricopeptide (TPR) repeat protein